MANPVKNVDKLVPATAVAVEPFQISELSGDVCLLILRDYLSDAQLVRMRSTCRHWRELGEHDFVLRPRLSFHGLVADERSGMRGVQAAFSARAEVCLGAIEAALDAREDAAARPGRVYTDDCPPCRDLLRRVPQICEASMQSSIAMLRANRDFFLSKIAKECSADQLAEEAMRISIEIDDESLVTQSLLDSEMRVCIQPSSVAICITKAAYLGRHKCLSHLLRQQDRQLQDPHYMQIHREVLEARARGDDPKMFNEAKYDIYIALSGGYIECATLLLRRCPDQAQMIRDMQDTYGTRGIGGVPYPEASLNFMRSITEPKK